MQTTLAKREFKDAIAGLSRIIPNRTSLPILRGIRFSADGNGTITAQATDLDQTATYSFQSASAEGAGSFIVDLDSLKPLTKGNGPDTLIFDSTAENQVAVTTSVGNQALRRSLTGLDPEDWPEMSAPNIATSPVPGFIDAYRTLVPFASTDATRYVLNSISLDVSEKHQDGSVMVSTDGRRLASRNHMTLPIDESCILRTSKFLAWNRLPADAEVGLAKNPSGSTIGIKAGQWQFTTKAIDGLYPNWRQVVPHYTDVVNHIKLSDVDSDLLLSALPSLPGLDAVTLVVRGGKVSVWARGVEDRDWTSLDIPEAKVEGADVAYTTVDRTYLKQALDAGLFRDIRFSDHLSPVLSEDGKGGTHVLMPMHGTPPSHIAKEVDALTQQAADDAEAAESTEATESAEGAEEAEEAVEVASSHTNATEPATTATTVDNDEQYTGEPESEPDKQPAAQQKAAQPNEENMDKDTTKKATTPEAPQASAIERVLAACDNARNRIREAGQAVSELASGLREAAKEQKLQAKEIEQARQALSKLQSISL